MSQRRRRPPATLMLAGVVLVGCSSPADDANSTAATSSAPVPSVPASSATAPGRGVPGTDASSAQVLAAPALPATPLAVLTKTESFGGLAGVSGLPAAVTNRLFEKAQDSFLAMAPATPQIIATGSDHYIQFSQPDLIVSATELVIARAATS